MEQRRKKVLITAKYLRNNPNEVFVFGDNFQHRGLGGAALLRNEANTYGFITKKFYNNKDSSFYHPDEYRDIYIDEIAKLVKVILKSNKTFLISKLGAGLANRYHIFEEVIESYIKIDLNFPNVKFLW